MPGYDELAQVLASSPRNRLDDEPQQLPQSFWDRAAQWHRDYVQPLGSAHPREQYGWMQELQQSKPNLAAFLRRAPAALAGIRPGVAAMRSFDSALRPLTPAELAAADAYRRILNPLQPSSRPSPAPREADPPSFYEMWSKQRFTDAQGDEFGSMLKQINGLLPGYAPGPRESTHVEDRRWEAAFDDRPASPFGGLETGEQYNARKLGISPEELAKRQRRAAEIERRARETER